MKKLALIALMFLLICSFPAHAEKWDFSKAQGVPYVIYKIDKDYKANNRLMIDARILFAHSVVNGKPNFRERSDDLGKEKLAATAIAAAKYIAQQTKADIVSVVIDSQPSEMAMSTTLAQCNYAPDGGGITGKDGWTYDMLDAQPRGLTEDELMVQMLWKDIRGFHQTDMGTDEEAVQKEIAKKMGIKPEEVKLIYFMPESVPVNFAEKVQPLAPVSP